MVELQRQAPRSLELGLVGSAEVAPGRLPRAGWKPEKEVAGRAPRSLRIDAVLGDPFAETKERGAMELVLEDVERDEPARMDRGFCTALPFEVDRAVPVVDGDDLRVKLPGPHAGVRMGLALRRVVELAA